MEQKEYTGIVHEEKKGGLSSQNALIADNFKNIIEQVDDANREGLVKTPLRCARAFKFLTQGYSQDPCKVLSSAIFTEPEMDEMIIVKDIELYSLCEHHMIPFYGRCHVAYFPADNKIVGLSKIPRVVDIFAKRLQVQERLTNQIAKVIDECLKPQGVAVTIEAKHLCVMMRGIQKQNSNVTTSKLLGVFRDRSETRAEYFNLIKDS